MTIYVDLVAGLNFAFDFLLLLTVSTVLKRLVSLKRVFFGSFLGSVSLIVLFLPIGTITLFFIKIIMSLVMCIVTFHFKDIHYTIQNMIYFYMTGTILGGFLYYLNLEFSYKNDGLIFFHEGLSVNYIFLIIISPIILYIYVKGQRKLKVQYNNYYKINVILKDGTKLNLDGFLDTGNKLIDPITNKAIILMEKECLKEDKIRSPIYVPYNSLNHHGLLKCLSPRYVEINGVKSTKYLIGVSEKNFKMDGINCILNSKCLEDLI